MPWYHGPTLAFALTLAAAGADQPQAQKQPPAAPPPAPAPPPSATVLPKEAGEAILGREVRSATGEKMGRIINVIVDGKGEPLAAVIDFGGFLGIGSRVIAVDWKALRFEVGEKSGAIKLDLTRDQVKAAPEYKENKPVVVLGPTADEPPRSDH
jgi:hypothetical protein